MKTLRILFVGIMAITCVSCGTGSGEIKTDPVDQVGRGGNDDGDHSIGGIPLDRDHSIWLSFTDTEENDLVKGLESAGEENFVDPGQYKLVSSPDFFTWGKPSDVVSDNPCPYPRLVLDYDPLDERGEDGRYMLYIRFNPPTKDGLDLEKITYTLTCPHIFGDDAGHEIITYWRKPTGWDESWPGGGHYRVCYRVECDGKEFTDISYSSHEQTSFATIVLDR